MSPAWGDIARHAHHSEILKSTPMSVLSCSYVTNAMAIDGTTCAGEGQEAGAWRI